MKLTWWRRLLIRLGVPVYVGHRRLNGWKGSLPYYAFRCPEHGVVETYPQGYRRRLECPKCKQVQREANP